MSVTGGIKLFDKSMCLEIDGSEATASSGNSSAQYMLDKNPLTYWRSVGSDDTTTETITIEFNDTLTFDRLFFLDINWKEFTVQYDVASVWTNFASVVGLSGSLASITETTFSKDTAYYEFTEVSTTKIRIQVVKTQTADQEKYCAQAIVTSELGTLVGFPQIKRVGDNRTLRIQKTLSGKSSIQKSIETFEIDLSFSPYTSRAEYNTDLDLMFTLFDRENPFLIWLCGGRSGSSYFQYTLRGFRLKDVIQMQVSSDYDLAYQGNFYQGMVDFQVRLTESI